MVIFLPNCTNLRWWRQSAVSRMSSSCSADCWSLHVSGLETTICVIRYFCCLSPPASAQLQTNKMSMVRIASVSVFNCWFQQLGTEDHFNFHRASKRTTFIFIPSFSFQLGEVMLFVICDETTGPKYLVWEVSRHQILCGEKFKVNTSAELHCVTIAISGSHCHNNTTKYLHTQQF